MSVPLSLTEPSVDDHRRSDLADFLRKKREALTPEAAGLPMTRRRRTPGLRREEVAELAGISASLYAWLEQAREVPISRRTVDALADALRLELHERRYLQELARPEVLDLRETPSPQLTRLVEALPLVPTMVLDHTWNILRRNAAAEAVFGHDGDDDEDAPNILRHVFLHPHFRHLLADWYRSAETIAEMFRLDYAGHAEDAAMLALVEELRAQSSDFEAIWERHNVRDTFTTTNTVIHCSLGALTFEPSLYGVIESPGLRLMVFVPIDDATRERIAAYLGDQRKSG